jgi:hypothetical protein
MDMARLCWCSLILLAGMAGAAAGKGSYYQRRGADCVTGQLVSGKEMAMSTPNGPSAGQHRAGGHQAAEKVAEKNSLCVDVPMIGTLTLPPPQQLAYVGGVAALIALDVIDWPVGLVLIAGHVLATRSSNKMVRDFGDALEGA